MSAKQDRYQQARRITIIGAITNALLAIFKVVIGFSGYSQALIADGIHSLSDVITDGMVLVAAKASSQDPDQEHPYGHGRIETFANIILAAVLVLIGIGIAYDAILDIIYSRYSGRPDVLVIAMAFISIVVNEGLYRATYRVGKRIQSPLLCSNAWHNRIDALSSLAVLIGVIFARYSFPFFDSIAAILVSLLVIKMGVSLAWPSVKELVDTGVTKQTTEEIMRQIRTVSGVKELHQLRTRSSGGDIFTDVHVQVDAHISVSEGHYIADKVYAQLVAGGFDISDVVVHIDAENDEHKNCHNNHLPDRQAIELLVKKYCQHLDYYHNLNKIIIHYLNNKIELDLLLSLPTPAECNTEDLTQQYQQALHKLDYISKIRLYFTAQ